MQLLNSKILPNDKNTRYSNKKHKISNILCFLSVVAFSYNKDGSPCRIWTYDPPVNSRMLYRWANEEYNAATTYPPGQLPDKYFRRSEA